MTEKDSVNRSRNFRQPGYSYSVVRARCSLQRRHCNAVRPLLRYELDLSQREYVIQSPVWRGTIMRIASIITATRGVIWASIVCSADAANIRHSGCPVNSFSFRFSHSEFLRGRICGRYRGAAAPRTAPHERRRDSFVKVLAGANSRFPDIRWQLCIHVRTIRHVVHRTATNRRQPYDARRRSTGYVLQKARGLFIPSVRSHHDGALAPIGSRKGTQYRPAMWMPCVSSLESGTSMCVGGGLWRRNG